MVWATADSSIEQERVQKTLRLCIYIYIHKKHVFRFRVCRLRNTKHIGPGSCAHIWDYISMSKDPGLNTLASLACNIHGLVGWNDPKLWCFFLLNSETIRYIPVICYAMENGPFSSMIYHGSRTQSEVIFSDFPSPCQKLAGVSKGDTPAMVFTPAGTDVHSSSQVSRPHLDLNHCLSSATSDTKTMGVPMIAAEIRVIKSYSVSCIKELMGVLTVLNATNMDGLIACPEQSGSYRAPQASNPFMHNRK